MSRLQKTALIAVGGPVNERCVGSAGQAGAPRDLRELLVDLRAARADGAARVLLVGGEPTLRRDLRTLLRAVGRLGLSAGLVTNGRMLLYPRMRQLLWETGVDYLRLSLHGNRAPTHDRLVGVPGAHTQALSALQALLQEAPASARVDVACTVTAANLDQLPQLARRLAQLPRRAAGSLRLVAPLAGLERGQWPSMDAVRRQLGQLLDSRLAQETGSPLVWEGFPHCVLPRQLQLCCEDLRRQLPLYGPAGAGAALPREEPGHRVAATPCQGCESHQQDCPGAPTWLPPGEDQDALHPLPRRRANSYNLELLRELPGFVVDAQRCSMAHLDRVLDRARDLLLEDQGRVELYHSPTRDFDEATLRQVKQQQQLYLDLCASAALGRRARQVRRTRAHPQCLRCSARQECCGAVKAAAADPFAEGERRLRAQLAGLRGTVLDVGCGEQPYRELIQTLVQAGELEYHGLDPDAGALARLRHSGLAGTFHHSTMEQFDDAGEASFDAVLALRSVNHLEHPARALEQITRLLRPGGTLLLSETTIYGLLRTADQVACADAGGAGRQEHYRNWDSARMLQLLKDFPLQLVEHHPVTPQTANEWFLVLSRKEDR